ncbi:putative Vesicle-associated membrane protein [Blattamonas nauphoetae]|uniref:Vesicle-associated membrane protein n=1 Tax=Blattamonas nauphoetae TaxID=2049346 RepID=A0ABQ9YI99_9EUKA|nr:putative Vesicle-associated membrane protein [Blattamonas nauphoetae]
MPIVYSVISRGIIVLSEVSNASGNMGEVTRKILEKLPSTESKMSYRYDDFTYHYMVKSHLCYMCLTDNSFDAKVAFSYLSALQQSFSSKYGERAYSASSNSMRDYNDTMRTLMTDYSGKSVDRIARAQQDVADTKQIMEQNIEKILNRGEKLDLLVEQSEELDQAASQFQKSSKKLERKMWYQHIWLWVIVVVVILLVIFFIVVIACGGFTFKRCRKSS